MTDVVFAFDVEDVYNAESDDALLQLCRVFAEEEVPLSLFVAGEKARTIRQRGRRDVIEAMAEHEICYHGNYWGDFPEPATRYGARLPFDEGVAFALDVESKGLHDVAEITGQFPVAWCCHQAQQSLPMQYALKLAGVRCWAGGPRGWLMNWLSWPRSNCVVSLQGDWKMDVNPMHRDRRKPAADPDLDLRAAQESFEARITTTNFVSFVGHPVCWVTSEWATLNRYATLFRRGTAGPYPRPRISTSSLPRSPADRAAAMEFVRKLLRWIKTRDDVKLTNYAMLCERDEEPAGQQWVDWQQLVELARRMTERLDAVAAFGTSFSPADVTGMLVFAMNYLWEQGRWPEQIPVQRVLGPTEAPLVNPGPVTIPRQSLFAGCLACHSLMMDDRRLPGKLRASQTDLGPAELLHAIASFIQRWEADGELPDSVTIGPAQPLPGVVDTPIIQDRRFGSSNMPAGFDDTPLWNLLRWQSWSYRPAVPGNPS
ncbi:MAG: hypothetical protein HN849_28605 [Victivallales bacterium]|nr:hypothetical protein [Victivallales bacterium]